MLQKSDLQESEERIKIMNFFLSRYFCEVRASVHNEVLLEQKVNSSVRADLSQMSVMSDEAYT